MKKARNNKADREMLPECGFRRGVRGKYAQRCAEGSNVVVLPPDLAKAFPTAESVHEALRACLALAEKVQPKGRRKRQANRSK